VNTLSKVHAVNISRRIGLSITAASAARFLLAQATSGEIVESTPSISN